MQMTQPLNYRQSLEIREVQSVVVVKVVYGVRREVQAVVVAVVIVVVDGVRREVQVVVVVQEVVEAAEVEIQKVLGGMK